MFSFTTKIVKYLTNFPKTIIGICLVLSLISIFPIKNLHWDLQLQDTLISSKNNSFSYDEIEKKFGGLGSLTVVLESPDSLLNYKAAKQLYSQLSKDSIIHFVDFETDIDFFKKHNLLYLNESDLDTISSRIYQLKKKLILSQNPFYVDIQNNQNLWEDSSHVEFLNLKDLEDKYYSLLSQSHGNKSGTIRVVDIYPKTSLSDLQANRNLLSKVTTFFEKKNEFKTVNVFYTGKVFDNIQAGRTLLPEAKTAGKITALFILLLLIIHFFKQPQLIFISALPIGLPILYTLALAGIFYGRINFFTLLLALVLPGQACQITNHILKRYFVERTQSLSPKLCIESAILGIGPSTGTSTAIMSSIFICMILVPVQGIQELGILGAIGSILNWVISILLTTSLLQIFQRKKAFSVESFRLHRNYQLTILSYKTNTIIISILSVISFFTLVYGGANLKFLYDFSKTELPREKRIADSLITETGFPQYEPIIILLPDTTNQNLFKQYKNLKAKGKIPTISKLYTLEEFSPKYQKSKKEKLYEIQKNLSEESFKYLDSTQTKQAKSFLVLLNQDDDDEEEYPEDIRKKFSDVNGNIGSFAFLFTNINPDNGLECRHLLKDLEILVAQDSNSYKMVGVPITRAKFLDLVLKNIDKTIFLGSTLVWLMLLLFYNRLSRAIFTILPSIFAISWLLFLINLFGIKLSAYSTIAFPILISSSIDGSLQLWNAYYEKRTGTALILLQRKFFSITISQMASLIGTYGLLLSSHPGLRSIGQISFIGLICISIAQFTLFTLIAGSLDNYRIRQRKKNDKATIP